MDWASFEKWVIRLAFGAAALIAAVALAGPFTAQHELPISETASGWNLWRQAARWYVEVIVLLAVPVILLALALRSGAHRRLVAAAIACPIWLALFGGLPLVEGLSGGDESGPAYRPLVAALAIAVVAVALLFGAVIHRLVHEHSPHVPATHT